MSLEDPTSAIQVDYTKQGQPVLADPVGLRLIGQDFFFLAAKICIPANAIKVIRVNAPYPVISPRLPPVFGMVMIGVGVGVSAGL